MSGASALLDRPGGGARGRAPRPPAGGAAPARSAIRALGPRWATVARLLAFAALALFSTLHWARLVAEPPLARLILAVLVATAGAAALASAAPLASARRRRPRPDRARTALPTPTAARARAALAVATAALARIALVTATAAGALLVIGLPPGLLRPGHLGDLLDRIDRGLAGVRTIAFPYAGADRWVRLTVLLLAPAVVALAAALAFWPARRLGPALRTAALALLVGLYGFALAARPAGGGLGRGIVLFGLIGAWLWLPRARRPDAAVAAAAVLVAGLLAVPVAARLDGHPPWTDYEHWGIWSLGAGSGVTFDWSQGYGPITWPRRGTTVLDVRSRRPFYWRAETLARFDGLRWRHTDGGPTSSAAEIPPRILDPAWVRRLRFTVRGLRSGLLVAPGTVLGVDGAGPVSAAADGTMSLPEAPLREGQAYAVTAYVPNPSERQLRAAPARLPAFARAYTGVALPGAGDRTSVGADPRVGVRSPEVNVGLASRAAGPDPAAAARILHSPYARTYRLARRLAAGRASAYDVVRATEGYLKTHLTYSERPPARRLPLDAFLFTDRIGYCQQFSGAMALLLRMDGIPARVAAGFAPGSYDAAAHEYRVRDLDAHSWVEVFFAGIGWVPFDPTPSAAPAARPPAIARSAGAALPASTGLGDLPRSRPEPPPVKRRAAAPPPRAQRPRRAPVAAPAPGSPPLALALGLAALAGAAAALAAARRRRAPGPLHPDAEVEELRSALARLGYAVPASTTLTELERRLALAAGPAAARHVRGLRERRFAGGSARPAGGRAALRRALTARLGPLGRLRGFVAVPPVRLTRARRRAV